MNAYAIISYVHKSIDSLTQFIVWYALWNVADTIMGWMR